jgi:hypothetical protein
MKTSLLIWSDDDIGGHKEGAIFCRRNNVVTVIPDSGVQSYNERRHDQLGMFQPV